VDAPTGQVHYRTMGDGEPLLLLHQSPSSSRQFEAALPLLAAAGIRAIAMDTPGYGLSDIPAGPPTITVYASVIPALLDQLGVERTAILGHHTGVDTACEFAVTHPDRVSKLILNGVPLFTEDERADFLAKHDHAPIALEPDGSHFAKAWQAGIAATPGYETIGGYGPGALEAVTRGVANRFGSPAERAVRWYGHHAAFTYDLLPRLRAIQQPALLLTNTGEDLYEHTRRAREVRPEYPYVELEGGTHHIVDEQPQAWTAAVVRFLLGAI
jgi:pimeloyl-ACP methyl ester carboxylesterase